MHDTSVNGLPMMVQYGGVLIPYEVWRREIERRAPGVAGDLARALCRAAMVVGTHIAEGERYGIRQREEAITESVLLDLRRQISRLRIRTLTHSEETEVGADWEWWIEGERQWFGFLVQAKRVHPIGRYRRAYRIGYRPQRNLPATRPRQIDSLLQASKQLCVPAIYALYNEAGAGVQYTQPWVGNECTVPPGADGVTALGAQAAHWLLSMNPGEFIDVESVAPHAFPWSCLAYCLGASHHGEWPPSRSNAPEVMGFAEETNESDEAYRAARFVLEIERSTRPGQFVPVGTEERIDPAIRRIVPAVRSEPPEYVPLTAIPRGDADNIPSHPLQETGTAPRYVVALRRAPLFEIGDFEDEV